MFPKMDVLYIEKTEIVFTDVTKTPYETHNFTCEDITEIFTGSDVRKSFFGLIKKPTRYICFKVKTAEHYLYEIDIDKEEFEKYVEEIKKFSARNRITMREKSGDTDQDYKL